MNGDTKKDGVVFSGSNRSTPTLHYLASCFGGLDSLLSLLLLLSNGGRFRYGLLLLDQGLLGKHNEPRTGTKQTSSVT